ncbi:ABC transporter permease [Hydrogenophaga sp.]|uniref:ABC transporter permease n=1 Tax=Hydrogenophaga sp. TaxID=1904254 RepID=UPI0035ADC9B8
MAHEMPCPADTARSLWQAWWQALLEVVRDKGVLLLLAGAPVLYGFFYPWFYGPEVVQRVAVAVVDQDGSGLSRQITRFVQASPRLDLRWVGSDEASAQRALLRGEIEGYLLLPPDLKRHVVRGQAVSATVQANAAYPLVSKAVQLGFAEAVGTASAGVEMRQLQARGQSLWQAQLGREPVRLQSLALFNPIEGYGSFVVPAVALIILQQTLLMGVAMRVATWAEAGRQRASARAWAGRLLAFCTLGGISGLFYFGWIFLMNAYPSGGNPLGALVLLACYVPAVVVLGCLLGWWMANRERVLQVLLFTALPLAFLAGFSWPAEALPEPLQALRWLAPSTAGIQASLRLNQLGASLADVWPQLLALLALGLGGLLWLAWLHRPWARRPA